MIKRLLQGMQVHTDTLATALFEGIHFKGEFLKQKATRQLFAREQYLPSMIIGRASIRGWQDEGELDTFARAKIRTKNLLENYQRPAIPVEQRKELVKMVAGLAKQAGLEALPGVESE
jgi:trimethylamine:corrinoid methyltransferase-like protein